MDERNAAVDKGDNLVHICQAKLARQITLFFVALSGTCRYPTNDVDVFAEDFDT